MMRKRLMAVSVCVPVSTPFVIQILGWIQNKRNEYNFKKITHLKKFVFWNVKRVVR
jgi:hypothetical protein